MSFTQFCRPGLRFAQYKELNKLGSIVKGCSYEDFIDRDKNVSILSFMKPEHPGEDRPLTLKGAALHLQVSGHFAIVHPIMVCLGWTILFAEMVF